MGRESLDGSRAGLSTLPRVGARSIVTFSRNPACPFVRFSRLVGTLTSCRASAVGSSTRNGMSARCRRPRSANSIGSGRASGSSGTWATSFNSGSTRSVSSDSRSGVVNSSSSGGVGGILSTGCGSVLGTCCQTGVFPGSGSGTGSSASTSSCWTSTSTAGCCTSGIAGGGEITTRPIAHETWTRTEKTRDFRLGSLSPQRVTSIVNR